MDTIIGLIFMAGIWYFFTSVLGFSAVLAIVAIVVIVGGLGVLGLIAEEKEKEQQEQAMLEQLMKLQEQKQQEEQQEQERERLAKERQSEARVEGFSLTDIDDDLEQAMKRRERERV